MKKTSTIGNTVLWAVFAISAILIGVASLRYLDFNIKNILFEREEALSTLHYPFAFYLHVSFGPIALISGIFQFLESFRKRKIIIHRLVGKVYIFSCILGALSGFVVAFFTFGGGVSTIGFSLLAILWFLFTLKAYQEIRIQNVTAHQKWMLRSYSLTFAAVTLRIWLGVLQGAFGLDFISSYQIVSWLCWVPNYLIIEAYIWLRFSKIEMT